MKELQSLYAGLAYWQELLDGYETRAAVPSCGKVPEALRSKEDEAYISIASEVTTRFEQVCREAGATISNGVELVGRQLIQLPLWSFSVAIICCLLIVIAEI